jgi:hypothetical protein
MLPPWFERFVAVVDWKVVDVGDAIYPVTLTRFGSAAAPFSTQ